MNIIRDDTAFNALVNRLIADHLDDLARYRIEDRATLRGYYDFLSQGYSAIGDIETAITYSDKARDLEEKEEAKHLRGVILRARLAALRVSPDVSDAAHLEAFKSDLRARVSSVPLDAVRDELIGVVNQSKMLTPELIETSVSASLDPLLANTAGAVPAQVAQSIIAIRQTLTVALPLLPSIAEVYQGILDADDGSGEEDRWTPRLVRLDPDADATPVVVGVWDTGIDTALYPGQLWTNTAETPNGLDDDGNGFVDDIHGIAFSLDRRPTTGPLADISALRGNKEQLLGFIIAAQDMQAGTENAGTEAYRAHLRSLNAEQMRAFNEDLSLMGGYLHGTHVAGVAVDGNPFARLVHITENWPWKDIPDEAPTVELGRRWGDNCRQAVEYLRQSGARVVNMSWRVSRSAFESMLEAKGVGDSSEERAELSRQIFHELSSGLEEAIRNAPEILFIAGSGNEDNDIDFNEYVPAGLRLPNLLTVGAVDHRDRFTSFTSTGEGVELYANGYRIESLVPGGQRVRFSGTSMAAPQVANLAAKLLALDPSLSPAEVIERIRANADPVPGRPGRSIIHPARTIEQSR